MRIHEQSTTAATSYDHLQIADVALLLTEAGERRVTETMVRADIDAAAPTNADGTLNLVHYAAWLIGKIHHGD